MGRLPDHYFDRIYAVADDPWQLSTRWYEQRKYAITTAMLPHRQYRHAFEPGCSIGTLTQRLVERCDHVTAIDVAEGALKIADERLRRLNCRDRVTLAQASMDQPWPNGAFDLVVLSEVACYFNAGLLSAVLNQEIGRLLPGTTVIAAHWRHEVVDYPLTGDIATDVIASTQGLRSIGRYCDRDVVIEVFVTGPGTTMRDV
jgi:SAM-dependent methyltransferase